MRETAEADGRAARREALRAQCRELEGLFVRQLFSAMRRATPDGDAAAGPGAGAFTEMLDDALASRAAAGFERGIGEALYRQLSRRLEAAEAGTDAGAPARGRPVRP